VIWPPPSCRSGSKVHHYAGRNGTKGKFLQAEASEPTARTENIGRQFLNYLASGCRLTSHAVVHDPLESADTRNQICNGIDDCVPGALTGVGGTNPDIRKILHDRASATLTTRPTTRARPAALRHLALVERGQCYLAEGKRAMARKDFQKVSAENANYPGLADHLVAVGE
jgi:hypothetical protein